MFQITQKKARKGKGGTEKEPHQNNKMLDLNSHYHFELNYQIPIDLPDSSACKESPCNAGDLGSIPGLGRSPGEGKATHSSILAWRIPWTV